MDTPSSRERMLAFLCYSCKANEFLLCRSRGLTMSLVSVIELHVTGQGCRVWLAFLVCLYLFSKVPREYNQRDQITGTLGKITYYIWDFFYLQVQCVNAFLVFTHVYTLDFCIIPLKTMIPLLSLLMSSLALIDDEKIASVFL